MDLDGGAHGLTFGGITRPMTQTDLAPHLSLRREPSNSRGELTAPITAQREHPLGVQKVSSLTRDQHSLIAEVVFGDESKAQQLQPASHLGHAEAPRSTGRAVQRIQRFERMRESVAAILERGGAARLRCTFTRLSCASPANSG